MLVRRLPQNISQHSFHHFPLNHAAKTATTYRRVASHSRLVQVRSSSRAQRNGKSRLARDAARHSSHPVHRQNRPWRGLTIASP